MALIVILSTVFSTGETWGSIGERKATIEVIFMPVRMLSIRSSKAKVVVNICHPVLSWPIPCSLNSHSSTYCVIEFCWLRKLPRRTKSQDNSQVRTTMNSGLVGWFTERHCIVASNVLVCTQRERYWHRAHGIWDLTQCCLLLLLFSSSLFLSFSYSLFLLVLFFFSCNIVFNMKHNVLLGKSRKLKDDFRNY